MAHPINCHHEQSGKTPLETDSVQFTREEALLLTEMLPQLEESGETTSPGRSAPGTTSFIGDSQRTVRSAGKTASTIRTGDGPPVSWQTPFSAHSRAENVPASSGG
jgi:hypothetical protein